MAGRQFTTVPTASLLPASSGNNGAAMTQGATSIQGAPLDAARSVGLSNKRPANMAPALPPALLMANPLAPPQTSIAQVQKPSHAPSPRRLAAFGQGHAMPSWAAPPARPHLWDVSRRSAELTGTPSTQRVTTASVAALATPGRSRPEAYWEPTPPTQPSSSISPATTHVSLSASLRLDAGWRQGQQDLLKPPEGARVSPRSPRSLPLSARTGELTAPPSPPPSLPRPTLSVRRARQPGRHEYQYHAVDGRVWDEKDLVHMRWSALKGTYEYVTKDGARWDDRNLDALHANMADGAASANAATSAGGMPHWAPASLRPRVLPKHVLGLLRAEKARQKERKKSTPSPAFAKARA